jgi:hypothetical protein
MTRYLAAILSALLLSMLAACDIATQAGEELLPVDATAKQRRCPHCGWIESKREILAGVADPLAARTYEYTVRMMDGSSSVFQQALPASWRLNERLTVIGGAGLPD